MKGNVFTGFSHFTHGCNIIWQPGLRLFLLVPILVNILLFTLMIMWAKSMYSGLMASLMGWLPEWLAFLEWFFWLVYLIVIIMVVFYGFVAAANLLGAPFYGYLSELTEQRLTGQKLEDAFSWQDFLALIPRTLKREIQKILYYLPRVLLLFMLGLVPGINALAAVFWVVFTAWMMAIQYLDYPADNHQYSFKEMLSYLREHRLSAFGFGLVVFGATLLPIVNLLALPAAVCGATSFWVNERSALSNAREIMR
ncbi:MAG: sulfate transporter CysZ [Oleiphilaceae bacterium]|nr:sulfate transporter CysZ [Oleiphilaceae bacterium]